MLAIEIILMFCVTPIAVYSNPNLKDNSLEISPSLTHLERQLVAPAESAEPADSRVLSGWPE